MPAWHKLFFCKDGNFEVNMYLLGGGCVLEVVTTCTCVSFTLNPTFVCSVLWDQYGKTAYDLAQSNKHDCCAVILKQVREQSILVTDRLMLKSIKANSSVDL